MPELHVVATVPAKPDAAEEVRAALAELVDVTRQEAGCLSYELFESAASPGTLVTLERWTDQEALDAHMRTPYIAAARAATEGKLAGDVEIHPLVPVR